MQTHVVRPVVAIHLLLAALVLAGCAPGRPVLSEAELQLRAEADAAEMAATFDQAVSRLLDRVDRRMADTDTVPTIHFLAISGGGDWGAFASGFLVGWGEMEDADQRRPEFDAVTGVSTGALIAPFAFLGSDEAAALVDGLYRNPSPDWVRQRWPFFFLPHLPSFATIPGLEGDIRNVVDPAFIQLLAEESREGKMLVVSATDLDLGRQKFWELGSESESALITGDFDRVQRMLMASTALPVVFPPVEIDQSLYGDGGVTANLLLRLDPYSPGSFINRWLAEHPDTPLPPVRYWIIINNQLEQAPETVQPRWPSVVEPSLETAIRSATLSEVRWLAAQADYVNAVFEADIEVRVIAIPNDWRPPVEGTFQQETMRSLSDLGRALATDPDAWTLWTVPPAIPTHAAE